MAPPLHDYAPVKCWLLVVAIAAGGCYSPSLRDCTVSCANPTDCAGDQVCTSNGWCAAPEASCEGVMAPDASTDGMVSMPDARSLCDMGCPNGTCQGGVCVIDCSGPDTCPGDVACPPNIPCKVVCGDRSCDHKVICGLASTCEVQCNGLDACADEIQCGKAACDVTCTGVGSCKRRVKCKDACACDVTCSGLTSCAEVPECPRMDACRLGKGCSSELDGCDRCE